MTPEQQRIAIAKSVGIYLHDGDHAPSDYIFVSDLPDYLNDLNAMHDAEMALSDSESIKFRCIATQMGLDWNYDPFMSSAKQRAKAYLRTIGKWEGGSDE